jgi:isopropylmalate/homocitrate/citramalate synthase
MKKSNSNKPWKTDKWFTSSWNFLEDVRENIHFSDNIQFHDVKNQKIAIAEKLAEIGIDRIEIGMPAVSEQDEAAIKEIVKRNLGPKIFTFARCMKEDVQRSIDCGVKNVVMEVPTSEHLLKYAYKWDMQKAIDLSIESTLFAHEQGLYVSFFTIDGTRTDIDTYFNLIQKIATEGHMDEFTVVDTFSGLNPNAVPFLIKKVKEHIKDKPIGVHFHDDFGLGVANTIIALASGADIAHTTISGIGERAGNASYEDIALSLLTMYGVDTGLKYNKIYPLSKYLQEISGFRVRQNRGIVGDDLADIESGIVATWVKNLAGDEPLELSPYLYSLTGHPEAKVTIGKMSGISTVDIFCDQLGLSPNEEQKIQILKSVKEKALEKSSLLTLKEFEDIVRGIIDKS